MIQKVNKRNECLRVTFEQLTLDDRWSYCSIMATNNGSKRKRSTTMECRTSSVDYMLCPREIFRKNISRLLKESSRIFPILKVSKSSVAMWGINDYPSLKDVPDTRYRHRPKREETLDVDFAMPKEIRQILEEEGLEKKDINRAIGRSEKKHKMMLKVTKGESTNRFRSSKPRVTLPPIISTGASVSKYSSTEPTPWLALSQQEPHDRRNIALWQNPISKRGKDKYLERNFGQEMCNTSYKSITDSDHMRVEGTKQSHSGKSRSQRIVLVSSNIPKCDLLTRVYRDDVIPIIYDYDVCTLKEILETIAKKLHLNKRNGKAKSILILCQGGPHCIYFLKHVVVTPKKLHATSFRTFVGFWRALAGFLNQRVEEEASVHILGLNMPDNEGRYVLLNALKSLMFPNCVDVDMLKEDTKAGREVLEQYFIYSRFQVWRTYQKSSFNDFDMTYGHSRVGQLYKAPIMRVAR